MLFRCRDRLARSSSLDTANVKTLQENQQTGGIVRTVWNQYTARAVTALKKSKSENDFTRTEHKICELDNRLRRRHRNHNRN